MTAARDARGHVVSERKVRDCAANQRVTFSCHKKAGWKSIKTEVKQLGKKVDLGRWPHIERNSPNWEIFFFTMIKTPSPQWDIGSDNSEALNLAKWGDFLLYEVLPDKMTCRA